MSADISESGLRLQPVDDLLTQHPFGNSDYTSRQLRIAYRRRLAKIASQLPVAAELLNELRSVDDMQQHHILGDTVLRCAVDHALVQVSAGRAYGLPLARCEELIADAVQYVRTHECGSPLSLPLARTLDASGDNCWVWDEEHAEDNFARAFLHLVEDHYGGRPTTPSDAEYAILRQGVSLLGDLLPKSSSSALTHTRIVTIVPAEGAWTTTNSSSEYRLGGTIFLSRRLLSSPWRVAEFLFHETLHQQMYDFRQGHSLLSLDFERPDAPTILSLWNVPGNNEWDIHRALAAFHVYVHLGLLASLAEQRKSELERRYDAPLQMTSSRTALSRAQYLGNKIHESSWDELGDAGKSFVDWFNSVIDYVDSDPPPKGSYIHLLLDRYLREASSVESRISNGNGYASATANMFAALRDSEIKSVRSLLVSVNAASVVRLFDDKVSAIAASSADPSIIANSASQFVQVRRAVASAISTITPNGYEISRSRIPDEAFWQIVERSSATLISALAK